MLRFGNVEEADYDAGRYRVYFPVGDVVSFPIPHVVFSTTNAKPHAPLTVGTWVACLMSPCGVEGVILGPYYTQNETPRQGLSSDEYSLALAGGSEVKITGDTVTISLTDGKVELAPDGIEISKGPDTLGGLIGELVGAIKTLAPIAAAPGSPTAPNPVDITKLTLLETRLSALLK